MTGRHLGERAAAFVDGALDLAERDRVVVHLARCAGCRDAVAEQRRVKQLLAGLGTPPVPPGLADRLRAVASAPSGADHDLAEVLPLPLPAPRQAVPHGAEAARTATASAPGPEPAPVPGRAGTRRRARRRTAVAAGAGVAGLAVAAGLVAASAGSAAVATPTVVPPVQRFTVEHTAVTGSLRLDGSALRVASVGVTGGVAPGLGPAPGTVTWTPPGTTATRR